MCALVLIPFRTGEKATSQNDHASWELRYASKHTTIILLFTTALGFMFLNVFVILML